MNKSFLAATLASAVVAFSMMTVSTSTEAATKKQRCEQKAYAKTAHLVGEYGHPHVTQAQRNKRWRDTFNRCMRRG
jgi:hypothetical protein